MTKLHRNIALFLCLLFVVFAAVQYNDPDAVAWIILYLAAAFLCYMGSRGQMPSFLPAVAAVMFLVGAYTQWPPAYDGISLAKGFKPSIEEARESLGMLICFLGMLYIAYILKQKENRFRKPK